MESILDRHSQRERRKEKRRKYHDARKGGINIGTRVGQKRGKKVRSFGK